MSETSEDFVFASTMKTPSQKEAEDRILLYGYDQAMRISMSRNVAYSLDEDRILNLGWEAAALDSPAPFVQTPAA